MAVNIKFADVIKKYTGDKKVDVIKWLAKVEKVAGLQGVTDLAKFVPLFLEEDAYDIYDQMEAARQDNYDEVKKALIGAFSLTPVQAFEVFKKRVLKAGESPDSFLADLRRLSSLFKVDSEALVACQFIVGMPGEVSGHLMALKEGSLDIQVLLACAKQILANRNVEEDSPEQLAAAGRSIRDRGYRRGYGSSNGQGGGEQAGTRGTGQGGGTRSQGFGPRCFGCNKRGHYQRECTTECYNCKKTGHIERNCPARVDSANAGVSEGQSNQGNAPGEAPGLSSDASPFPMGYQ